MKNKICIFAFLIVSFQVDAQLHSSYSREGVGYSTGGKTPYEIYMYFYRNQTFIKKTKGYSVNDNKKMLVDTITSKGTWTLRQDTLILDFTPDTVYRDKQYDRYLVRRKELIRITFDDRAKYKALGEILKVD